MSDLRIAFAGDRDIAVSVLKFMLSQEVQPLALLVPETIRASHADELVALCPFLPKERVLWGHQFRETDEIVLLRGLRLDYVIGVHFPYIIPEAVLSVPRVGFLNLHPAYLPYNRGWHTASWALLEGTPIGATLHFMNDGVDMGDIVHQEQLDVSAGDTAHTLYKRLKGLELKVFKEAWPQLMANSYRRRPQVPNQATAHKRQDLLTPKVQQIDLEETVKAGELLCRLRALTTNNIREASFYEVKGKRFRVQVHICEERKSEHGFEGLAT